MSSRNDESLPSAKSHAPAPDRLAISPGLASMLVVSAWCGLVAGLLEVAAIVVRK
jgi:hypothetical protein